MPGAKNVDCAAPSDIVEGAQLRSYLAVEQYRCNQMKPFPGPGAENHACHASGAKKRRKRRGMSLKD